jgi:hypothetical protein
MSYTFYIKIEDRVLQTLILSGRYNETSRTDRRLPNTGIENLLEEKEHDQYRTQRGTKEEQLRQDQATKTAAGAQHNNMNTTSCQAPRPPLSNDDHHRPNQQPKTESKPITTITGIHRTNRSPASPRSHPPPRTPPTIKTSKKDAEPPLRESG